MLCCTIMPLSMAPSTNAAMANTQCTVSPPSAWPGAAPNRLVFPVMLLIGSCRRPRYATALMRPAMKASTPAPNHAQRGNCRNHGIGFTPRSGSRRRRFWRERVSRPFVVHVRDGTRGVGHRKVLALTPTVVIPASGSPLLPAAAQPDPTLHTDESAPLGGESGPNPSRLLVAAVAVSGRQPAVRVRYCGRSQCRESGTCVDSA